MFFFVRLPFLVWYFLIWEEGGRGVSLPLIKNLPTPCNFCISGSPLMIIHYIITVWHPSLSSEIMVFLSRQPSVLPHTMRFTMSTVTTLSFAWNWSVVFTTCYPSLFESDSASEDFVCCNFARFVLYHASDFSIFSCQISISVYDLLRVSGYFFWIVMCLHQWFENHFLLIFIISTYGGKCYQNNFCVCNLIITETYTLAHCDNTLNILNTPGPTIVYSCLFSFYHPLLICSYVPSFSTYLTTQLVEHWQLELRVQ